MGRPVAPAAAQLGFSHGHSKRRYCGGSAEYAPAPNEGAAFSANVVWPHWSALASGSDGGMVSIAPVLWSVESCSCADGLQFAIVGPHGS